GRVISEAVFGIERSVVIQVDENAYVLALHPVGHVGHNLGALVGTTRIRERSAGNVVVEAVTAVSLLGEAGLGAGLFPCFHVRSGQGPVMLGTDMNLNIVGHLPERTPLEERLDPVGEAVFVLLPVGHLDYGSRLDFAVSRTPYRQRKGEANYCENPQQRTA